MTDKTTKSIYKRLRDVQLDLKAPKTEEGRFGKSRSAEMIYEAAKPVCHRNGLTLVVSDELVLVGDRHYVKATATVYDDEGNSVSATANAWEGGLDRGLDASQVTGKASSYARKYAMGGLFDIDDTKDADSKDHPPVQAKPAVGSAPAPKEPESDVVSDAQVKKMHVMFNELGLTDRAERLRYCKTVTGREVETSKELTKTEASKVIEQLQSDLESLNEEMAS